ncbi:MAG: cyclic nucleotide-binding domain-containing protein [Pseudomonadota bacterium]
MSILTHCANHPIRDFAAGDVLLEEGRSGTELYVLIAGKVAVMRGAVEVARIREPGALFGEMSVLLQRPYSASVVAKSAVRAHHVEDAGAFLSSSPAVALHCARLLAQRLQDATTYLADFKAQFSDRSDHFGMVDEILESLINQQWDEKGGGKTRGGSGDSRL